eukprot:15022948-Alexandrium_andersonii.AAC.1
MPAQMFQLRRRALDSSSQGALLPQLSGRQAARSCTACALGHGRSTIRAPSTGREVLDDRYTECRSRGVANRADRTE